MAGIKVCQHEIFKIGTNHLKRNDWNLTIDKNYAYQSDEIISLFDSQMFRLISKILNSNNINYMEYVISIIIEDKKDFNRACEGFYVNGIFYKRFVGTTGGLKNNSVFFVNSDILSELNNKCESKSIDINMNPAKYEAYKALTCSASQIIPNPNKILVVKDCIIKYVDKVIYLDDTDEENTPKEFRKKQPDLSIKEMELENNGSDGFNLCTIEYMEKCSKFLGLDYVSSGLCLRNKWLKGMMYAFPIVEFVEQYNNGDYLIEDIWGNYQDIREVDLILTESSLKLWNCYNSVDDYVKNYQSSGYNFSVTKINSKHLRDKRELNYQYLQSFNFNDDDIAELCNPTVDKLKNSMGGNIEDVLSFLGIGKKYTDNDWKKAIYINQDMLNDPYIIDSIHRYIKNKILEAKIGKLVCDGDYQVFSNDPFCLMESIIGREPIGLLNKDEAYSSYWCDKNEYEILAFRSPMSNHNNIRKLKLIDNEETRKWYRYMDNVFIVNSHDSFCKAENGEDCDGDTNYLTNNKILLKNFRNELPIMCVQKSASKKKITNNILQKSNRQAFGNNVGTITNYITSMIDVQSAFDITSIEYQIMQYRIACGQLYQQSSLDSIKGIISKNMPKHWYELRSCTTDLDKKICANKKPYFMGYRYSKDMKSYKNHIDVCNQKSIMLFGMNIDELKRLQNKNHQQIEFLKYYSSKTPLSRNNCTMNKICYYIEQNIDNYKFQLKKSNNFDYTFLRKNRKCFNVNKEKILELYNLYQSELINSKNNKLSNVQKEDLSRSKERFKLRYYNFAKELVQDNDERLNIFLDLCYGQNKNKHFMWDCVGDLIISRLEELKYGIE